MWKTLDSNGRNYEFEFNYKWIMLMHVAAVVHLLHIKQMFKEL